MGGVVNERGDTVEWCEALSHLQCVVLHTFCVRAQLSRYLLICVCANICVSECVCVCVFINSCVGHRVICVFFVIGVMKTYSVFDKCVFS